MKVTNEKGESLKVTYSRNNVHVIDSYQVKSEDIPSWVKLVREAVRKESRFLYKRTDESWEREWRAHNVLYSHNMWPERTRSVDLNEDESFIRRAGYYLLSKMSS